MTKFWTAAAAGLVVTALMSSSASAQAAGPSFDFVYNSGHVIQFQGPNPPAYNEDYTFDLAAVYGPYVGDGFIYSSYTTTAQFLALGIAYVAQFPGTGISTVGTAGSNSLGETVGSASVHGWSYSGGTFTNFSVGFGTYPRSVNDLGQIVGICDCGLAGTVGFLYDHGTVTLIKFPGAGGETDLFGIDDSGEIVGSYFRTAQSVLPTPFVYDNGRFFNIPGAYYGNAVGVNDQGDVMGWSAGDVPEPSIWAMLLLGFAGLGFSRCQWTQGLSNRAAELGKCIEGRSIEPCGPGDPLALRGSVRFCEQRGVESDLNAHLARHSIAIRRARLVRPCNSDRGILGGRRRLRGLAQTDLNHKPRSTIYPEPREEGSNSCSG